MLDSLPNEVLNPILEYLRNPRPLPLSRPPRSAMRQPDLCAMARVGKVRRSLIPQTKLTPQRFYPLIQPLLYKHIFTDNFHRLLTSLDLKSNARRLQLALTESLHIEYVYKPVDVSYRRIFCQRDDQREEEETRAFAWNSCGMTVEEEQPQLWMACSKESRLLQEGLAKLSLPMSRLMGRLRTVAVASIYGVEPRAWQAAAQHARSMGKVAFHVPQCKKAFHRFLSTGNLHSLCIRDPDGPLALPLITDSSYPQIPLITTQHIQDVQPDPEWLPSPFGRPTRWMYDGPADGDWAVVLRKLGTPIQYYGGFRFAKHVGIPLDLAISCSTGRYSEPTFSAALALSPHPPINPLTPNSPILSYTEQRFRAQDLAAEARYHLGFYTPTPHLKAGAKDRLVWEIAADSAQCEACGSCCPV